jgi:hypothetical protein
MSRIMLDVPDDTLLALKLSPEGMGEALRMAGAAKLFELGNYLQGLPPNWLVFLGRYFSLSWPSMA